MLNRAEIQQQYNLIKAKGLRLDMSRGKPGPDALDFSNGILDFPHNCDCGCVTENGVIDCRNYGVLDGIPPAKRLLAPILGVEPDRLIIGGNSSLQLMYDAIVREMVVGAWRGKKIKFLCPVPGYDRHFSICESLDIEMLNVPLNSNRDGPDMDKVEELINADNAIKGMWCVPIYANPTGITYSDEVVRRLAALPAGDDFRIFWDCAYIVHHLTDTPDRLLNLLDECESAGCPDRVYMFASTSKITFPGGGLGFMAASERNSDFVRRHMGFQTIGGDKLNQLRHVDFFKDFDGITRHMSLMRSVLRPKFDAVLESLETMARELAPLKLGSWHTPKGGYFISFDGLPGTAKRTVQLCAEAGVILTPAGATFPYQKDPLDTNIRIAPSFPPLDELRQAMEVFCLSVKLAAAEVASNV